MRQEHWRFDKRIPMAVIIMLALQILGAIIWATQLDARVNQLESLTVETSQVNEKFARLEERLDFMKQNLVTVRGQLDHLTDKLIRK